MKKKIVLITGITGGIGKATAALFRQNKWHIIGVDIKRAGKGNPADEFYNIDLSNNNKVKKVCRLISGKHNYLNAIVNNAAIQISKNIKDLSVNDWDKIFAVNVRPTFLLAKLLYPLLKSGRASIVNISSVHAIATSQNISAYASSKGALLSLTRAMALEFAKDRIRVNAVLPGAVDTRMLRQGLNRNNLKGNQKEKLDMLSKRHPLERIGTPKEVAQMIYFLTNNNQSSFITGQGFIIDGGTIAKLSTE